MPKDVLAAFENAVEEEMQSRVEKNPAFQAWWEIARFYKHQKPAEFNAAVAKARELSDARSRTGTGSGSPSNATTTGSVRFSG